MITPITSLSVNERQEGFLKEVRKSSEKWGIDLTSTLIFIDRLQNTKNEEGGQQNTENPKI